jgi:hypothetical protein
MPFACTAFLQLFFSVNNCANAKPSSPTREAPRAAVVEFKAFPWIEDVAAMLQLHTWSRRRLRKWRKQFVSGLSIERADLKMEETKHVSKQRFS